MLGFLNKMKKVGCKGFTLVELMIVVAIIGILAAIAVPQFLSYRVRSYNTAAKAVAHNLKADNANLNAEIGVYGHTNAAAATLVAVNAVAAAADTFTVAALRIAATPTVAGARLVAMTTAGGAAKPTRTMAVGISLGNNMIGDVRDWNDVSDNSACCIFARHYRGDVAYGIDSDIENVVYSVHNPNWRNTAGLGATVITPTAVGVDDINNIAGGGLPTVAWTPAI